MEPYWIVGAIAAVLIALAIFVTIRYRKYRRERQRVAEQQLREQPIRDWLKKCKDASPYVPLQLIEAGPPPAGFEDFPGVKKMLAKQDEAHKDIEEEYAKKKAYRNLVIRAEQEADPTRRQALIVKLETNLRYLTNEQATWVRMQLVDVMRTRAETLLANAKNGDPASLIELAELVRGKYCSYYFRCGEHYTLPDDWDDLVAELRESPELDEFAFVDADIEEGKLGLMAARALRERSLRQAKIVRAYCMEHSSYREAVGEVLFAELAKMVDAIHAERGMFRG